MSPLSIDAQVVAMMALGVVIALLISYIITYK